MKYKRDYVFYVDIGACITYWTLHNSKFDMNDQWVNKHFIINYFKNI